jgi:phosphoglycolate phosphatase
MQRTEGFRAIAFDLDGTLIDTMPDLSAAVNLTLSMLGARELPEARVRSFVGDGIEQLVLRALTESLGGPPRHYAHRVAAVDLFRRFYLRTVYSRSKVYPGVAQALRSLTEAGMTLCCVTNKDSAFALPLLEQAGLGRFLSFTLCADRTGDRKPSPNMLLAACARFGVPPGKMLYVGDSGIDVAAARAAGCPVVLMTYGYGRDRPAEHPKPDGSLDMFDDLLAFLQQSSQRSELKLCPTGAL